MERVNIDALIDASRPEWDRLHDLAKRRTLTGPETDELIRLYRAGSADLAEMKTTTGRTPAGDYLSNVLGAARYRITGAPENAAKQLPRFFLEQLPAALYRLRWDTLVVAVSFIAITWAVGWWASSDAQLMATIGDETQLRQYADEDFVAYYSDHPEAVFAGMVWTNNAWIAAQSIMFGITGIWPLYVMMQNAVGLGTSAAVMFFYDRGDDFLLFILPHGLLEMTAIFVAGAAGFRIFWAWIAPGRVSRGTALAREGRALATVVVGLILALALSGIVEGFVTRQEWPHVIKIGVGAVALGVFLAYMLIWGRRASRRGATGDLTEFEAGTSRLVAG